jgi:hypothetical protein
MRRVTLCLLVLVTIALALSSTPARYHAHGHAWAGRAGGGAVRVVPGGVPGPLPATETGPRPVAFRPSGSAVPEGAAARAPRVRAYATGTNAIEPTLGVDPGGRVFFIGVDGAQWPAFPTQTMRSDDAGKTWDDVTPPPPQDHVTTEDPYIFVDETTGRVFSTDFMLPCTAVSRSDDAGESWETSVTACDLLDHQTVFAGPPVVSDPAGYPNVVYYCAVDAGVATLASAVSCLKSTDGGATFLRTGEPAFLDVPDAAQGAGCPGGSGHGVAGPDGTIYLPRGICSEPWLAISRDEGASWEHVRVAGTKMGADGRVDHDAAVAVDGEGNLYYSWTGADLKPYLAVSRDGGESWSRPVMIAPPGVKIATLIALDVASPGRLAVAFVGSKTQKAFGTGEYDGNMMATANALAADPVFYATTVNPPGDPIDGTCATGSCGSNREFIDVAIAPDGTTWAAFSDGCFDGSCNHYRIPFVGISVGRGIAGRLVGGPRLR